MCSCSQVPNAAYRRSLFHEFKEPLSVADKLTQKSDMVVYRFFYLPKENYLRQYMIEIKIGSFLGPDLARESNYRLKVMDGKEIKSETTGIVSSKDTAELLTAIVCSEIFSLPQKEQILEADDGGVYVISTKPFFATTVFEKTTKSERKLIWRMKNFSSSAIEVASVFERIAEDCFQKSALTRKRK